MRNLPEDIGLTWRAVFTRRQATRVYLLSGQNFAAYEGLQDTRASMRDEGRTSFGRRRTMFRQSSRFEMSLRARKFGGTTHDARNAQDAVAMSILRVGAARRLGRASGHMPRSQPARYLMRNVPSGAASRRDAWHGPHTILISPAENAAPSWLRWPATAIKSWDCLAPIDASSLASVFLPFQ